MATGNDFFAISYAYLFCAPTCVRVSVKISVQSPCDLHKANDHVFARSLVGCKLRSRRCRILMCFIEMCELTACLVHCTVTK